MDTRAKAIFDRLHGAFDLADVAVGGNDVEFSGFDGGADALKFAVGVYVLDAEGPVAVGLDCCQDAFQDSLVAAVGGGDDGAISQITRDGVQETEALHKEEIDAKSDVPVKIEDGRREWDSLVCWGTGSGGGSSHLSFEDGDVRAVDNECAFGVVRCDGAIVNAVPTQDGLELSFGWASNLAIKGAGSVGVVDLALGEQRFVFGYGGEKRIRVHRITRDITVVDVQTGGMFRERHD